MLRPQRLAPEQLAQASPGRSSLDAYERLLVVMKEHLTQRKIAEMLSEPDTKIDAWMKIRNEP